ncbi:AMP-dependent synthetase/ligase [Barrientosiimonas humi]|uniref:AMP-dependent synthetase/ligase n=2 Tax=Barrientosiimonas TaxID=1535207 RepID=UPI00370DA068
MQEFEVPALVVPTAAGNLGLLPSRNATVDPRGVGYSRRTAEGGWSPVTHAQFADEVERLAKGFMAAGIEPGDRVALLSRTRYEWTLVDFALLAAGAVVVPLYDGAPTDQIGWVLSDSGAVAAVVETAEHAAAVGQVRPDLDRLRDVWQIDSGGLEEIAAGADDVTDAELRSRTTLPDRDTLATVIYTSGTTGRPKGVELTHGNFLTLTENAVERLKDLVDVDDAATLLFLPLAHVFARFVQVVAVYSRVRLGHSPEPDQVLDDLGTFRPTFVLSVPRMLEQIYNRAQQQAVGDGRGTLFARAARVAEEWSRALDKPRGPSVRLKLQHAAMDRLVYRGLREALGGRLDYAMSGGAPLGERLGHVLRGMGLPVLEGYGLTETTASTTVNTPQLTRMGTVGQPLPGVAVRIAEDGEVQVRGAGVFRGYWDDEVATERTMTDDGWLRTGDMGRLDGHGFLKITGRKSELIVTSTGQNVSPAALEGQVRSHPLVSQVVVVGEGRPHLGALVTLDAPMLALWGDNHDRPGLTPDVAADDAQVREEIARAIGQANASPDATDQIRTFEVLREDLTAARGYLTPSGKVRRELVLHDFADEVERLYAQDANQVS